MKNKIKHNRGITLVALVITVIALLILAGVSMTLAFNSDGLFKRAENTGDKYRQAKAKETLELALNDAKIQKYSEGLTDQQLTDKINEIGEELPNRIDVNISQAIIDGYIFKIDRTIPKILEYVGPANEITTNDEIIITAIASNSETNGWVSEKEAKVKIIGAITANNGKKITNVNASKDRMVVNLLLEEDGKYIIDNITESGKYVINATNNKGKVYSKEINVEIKVDATPPTIENVTTKAEQMKINISATGHDRNLKGEEESGIKQFNYTISPTDGIPEDAIKGKFIAGETIEILSQKETTYTITVTAEDSVGNEITIENATSAQVTTRDGLTIAEAKEALRKDGLLTHLGTKIIDYKPLAGGTWRIYYYDTEDDGMGNGYFGPTRTVYLLRDNAIIDAPNKHIVSSTSDNTTVMRRMNPKWRDSEYAEKIDETSEMCSAWFCDPGQWADYKEEGKAEFAIGGPTLELFIAAYNVWIQGASPLDCYISNSKGYSIVGNTVLSKDPYGFFWVYKPHKCFLASPASYSSLFWIDSENNRIEGGKIYLERFIKPLASVGN